MKKKARLSLILTAVVVMTIILSGFSQAAAVNSDPTGEKIESFIKKQMKKNKIPGASVVVVKNEATVYEKGFGYADLEEKKSVSQDTLFEIGSNSKAFTALGVLSLEKDGLIKLSDPVKKYIPWFDMKYKEKSYDISLEQLLHHTSGIPYTTIGDIPEGTDADSLEKTVRTVLSVELENKPGLSYRYATVNYDILGYIIQLVSGQSFEDYMYTKVLLPMGLDNTFLIRDEKIRDRMAKGYKINFGRAMEFDAPRYRGNTPAGYFISNSSDISRWMKMQLGTDKTVSGTFMELISKAQTPDYTVQPSGDGSFYAMGWSVRQIEGKTITHGGANPNFTSYISLRPEEGLGVAVLTNLGNVESEATMLIAQGIMDIFRGEEPDIKSDENRGQIDTFSIVVVCVSSMLILVTLWFIARTLIQLIQRKRRFSGKGIKGFVTLAASLIFVAGFGYCLYLIPDVLFGGFKWNFVSVWGPGSILYAVYLSFSAVALFFLLFLMITFFEIHEEKPFFVLGILSIGSGLGNAFVIFALNAAVGMSQEKFQFSLFIYFIMGIVVNVFGTRMVRKRMIAITNDIVYQKRMSLINNILKSSYQKINSLEEGKIHAGLNNDTELVSNYANVIVGGLTSLITLICCFIYLGVLNIFGLIISVAVISMAAGLYFVVGKSANKVWERTRDIQNVFFKFIKDLTDGFKELYMNEKKRDEFEIDMGKSCEAYKTNRIKADMKFVNVFVVGELLFIFAIAAVSFVFPVIFNDISEGTLRSYVFIFLYMTNPVHGVLNIIPNTIQFRVSWKRINDLLQEISTRESSEAEDGRDEAHDYFKTALTLKGVEYEYKSESGEKFKVGPIDYEFNTGEVIFITGGNGSGKTTLAKLVTGLYMPENGVVSINGKPVNPQQLSQNYSAVFSDFYLFDKLYGIDFAEKQQEINQYLKILRIEDKVQVVDGKLSTTRLSTGQRKRLALLVSYLEDRPIFLFDEWAADQDPEFREYFYHKLLPELKKRGKCVIAITHDDRYFGLADRVIKMELGKIVETDANKSFGRNEFVTA